LARVSVIQLGQPSCLDDVVRSTSKATMSQQHLACLTTH
jgi:hypothetical protein